MQLEKNNGPSTCLQIMKKKLLAILLATLVILLFIWGIWIRTPAEEPSYSFISAPIRSSSEGFARAIKPAQLSFPEDLGPHDDFQTEWWYYTGNLETDDRRPFGFQLTFFRRALSPNEIDKDGASAWRASQIYMAHFTISDIEDDRFYTHEKFSRGAVGLAGAQSDPYRVWLDEWFVEEGDPGLVSLSAAAEDVSLKLNLEETMPPILHGDEGLSQKGSEVGNASYYYSVIGQEASGEITIVGQSYPVQGKVWKDHEYSTSALGPEAVGWDWYSLQLDNGSALTFFEIRQKDGELEPLSSGIFIQPDGSTRPMKLDDWQVEVTDEWTSPSSSAAYPAGWKISVPSLDLTLEGRPLMADQELNLSTVYWEGAVAFEGTQFGEPVSALGYIELTGYSSPLTGRF